MFTAMLSLFCFQNSMKLSTKILWWLKILLWKLNFIRLFFRYMVTFYLFYSPIIISLWNRVWNHLYRINCFNLMTSESFHKKNLHTELIWHMHHLIHEHKHNIIGARGTQRKLGLIIKMTLKIQLLKLPFP